MSNQSTSYFDKDGRLLKQPPTAEQIAAGAVMQVCDHPSEAISFPNDVRMVQSSTITTLRDRKTSYQLFFDAGLTHKNTFTLQALPDGTVLASGMIDNISFEKLRTEGIDAATIRAIVSDTLKNQHSDLHLNQPFKEWPMLPGSKREHYEHGITTLFDQAEAHIKAQLHSGHYVADAVLLKDMFAIPESIPLVGGLHFLRSSSEEMRDPKSGTLDYAVHADGATLYSKNGNLFLSDAFKDVKVQHMPLSALSNLVQDTFRHRGVTPTDNTEIHTLIAQAKQHTRD